MINKISDNHYFKNILYKTDFSILFYNLLVNTKENVIYTINIIM